jgi:hypothetical protein
MIRRARWFLVAALAAACGSTKDEAPAPSPAPAPSDPAPLAPALTPVPTATAGPWKLVEDGDDGASCTRYKVVDARGAPAQLPKDVADRLECFAGISADGRVVFYQKDAELRTYDLLLGKDDRLVLFDPGGEGLDGPAWSGDGTRVGFVSINQAGYPKRARLFTWRYADGAFTDKQRHDIAAAFECGSVCLPEEWGWKDAGTVFFTGRAADGTPGKVETLAL